MNNKFYVISLDNSGAHIHGPMDFNTADTTYSNTIRSGCDAMILTESELDNILALKKPKD